jgi:hypothetical protein
MKEDQILAVVSIALGILGLIPAYPWIRTKLDRGPKYRTLALEWTLELADRRGKLAHFCRRQHIQVVHGELSEIWIPDLRATGRISGTIVDGEKPDLQESIGGVLSACKHFHPPVLKGQKRTVEWTNDLLESFPKNDENFDYTPIVKTDYFQWIVKFPKGRPCKTASLQASSLGGSKRPLDKRLRIEKDGSSITATVKKPKVHQKITLFWTW